MPEIIKSLQNPKIKQIIKLRKAAKRKQADLIIIEGRREIMMAISSGVVIEALFYCKNLANNKVNIHTVSKNGWNALMYAIRNGHTSIAKLLINSDADINLKNKDNWTPLHFAIGKNNIVEIHLSKFTKSNLKKYSYIYIQIVNPLSHKIGIYIARNLMLILLMALLVVKSTI